MEEGGWVENSHRNQCKVNKGITVANKSPVEIRYQILQQDSSPAFCQTY